MRMTDVRVGMQLRSTVCPSEPVVTVTEITRQGFRYSHEPCTVKLGNPDGIPQFGVCRGGEHFGLNGEAFYDLTGDSQP